MKKSATIPYIPALGAMGAEQLRAALLKSGVELTLDSHNWATDYPYAPIVTARIAYDGEVLALMFDVSENHTKAVEMNDNGAVWEDSCVEFFVANPVGEGYYNFEMNAIGTLLAAYRLSRDSATHFDSQKIGQVKRFVKFDHQPIDITEGCSWWAAEVIPFSLMGLQSAPKSIKANLYKCGDKLAAPHFMSWSPITLDKPNFHCPDFFGTLIFEEYE